MGSQCSSKAEISALWAKLPEGRQIVITRDKITISDIHSTPAATLEFGSRVMYEDIGELSNCQTEDIIADMNDDSSVGRLGLYESSASLHTVERDDMVEEFARDDPNQEVINISGSPEWKSIGDNYGSLSDQPMAVSNKPEHASNDSIYHERNPTTYFPTLLDFDQDVMELEKMSEQFDIENKTADNEIEVLSQKIDNGNVDTHETADCEKVDGEKKDWEEVIKMDSVEARVKTTSSPVVTEEGHIIQKKAKQFEQKGKRECHVYFTPRTASEIWPPLVVTVDETWPLVKVIRKSLAEAQRTIIKGDREGTHDWVFKYHPNKEIRKIKSELKVLFGRKALVCLGGNLKKNIKDMTNDLIIKIWILQKNTKTPKKLQKAVAIRRARSSPNTSYVTSKVTMKRRGRRKSKNNG